MNKKYENDRIDDKSFCNAYEGKVVWSPVKSIWITTMYLVAIVGGYMTISWKVFVVSLISTIVTLCLGHSLGMHRRLIHRSYNCPKWLEYFFVHLGVIVGLAGPRGMMYTHDLRDWAQRQTRCHDYFGHRQSIWIDGFWQLHCDVNLDQPPVFKPENSFQDDSTYQWMEKYWMGQQLPWALLFFVIGGLPWVIWGICVRVAVSVTGHWFIGYFAHNKGIRHWHVVGASVQGFNIKFAALVTMGESYHNNHHAFPGSAKLSIKKSEFDPGWLVLKSLEKIGLVSDLKTAKDLPERLELMPYLKNN